ncbi:MAG: SagB/ThcOx family dehydrogenase [Fretibacterium sp.]|nr:SagB/ThcOx family dehydrogenase [Fretibacterium sp.]
MNQDPGRVFMRATCYENMTEPSDQEKGLPRPPAQRPAEPGKRTLPLPRPEAFQVPPMDLRAAIEARRSVRTYSPEPLSLEELSWLLWASQGVRKTTEEGGGLRTWRTVPAAGGRHPFETYLVLRAVEGLQPGLYRFLALDHTLQELDAPRDLSQELVEAFYGQEFAARAAVSFIWAVDLYRIVWRYKARAYRYFHLDAGHICQNLCLAALPIACGVCEIGAFYDHLLTQLLGLRDEDLMPVYAATVGKVRA